MSMGYGALAEMIAEDEKTVIYAYGGYNLNISEYKNENCLRDGLIMVDKSCFCGAEIREKIKRMPSGRKKFIVKRIKMKAHVAQYVDEGLITIENCSNNWTLDGNVDLMAYRLLFKLFDEYQDDEIIPKIIGIDC